MGQSVDALLDQVKQEAADRLREILSVDYPPASDPGEAPHRRTGRLADSYTIDAAADGERIVVTMTPGVDYADYLEYGTAGMAARPHRQPLADWLAATLPDRLAEAVTLDLLETLEPQGGGGAGPPPAAASPPGFFGRAAAGVRSFFGF